MNIAVTGGTGYVGERLIDAALRDGHSVVSLSRRPAGQHAVAWLPYDLGDEGAMGIASGTHAIFHLAARTHDAQGDAFIEVEAARRLAAAAVEVGARFVFVSSQSAREDAPTPYGRIKWQIERVTLDAGGVVVRPGQVYGGKERALFGTMCTLVRRLPVLPMFLPDPVVQPVHVDDLAAALLASLSQPPATVLCVGSPEGVGFSRFLQAIARERVRRWRPLVPVPAAGVRWAASLLGSRRAARLGLDRLVSLFALPSMSTQRDLGQLGVTLRGLDVGMSRSGSGRRLLLRESHCLLSYVLREHPASCLMRRYVRAIEALRAGRALALPRAFMRIPALFGLLDGGDGMGLRTEIAWRLDAATMLAEASPQGARRCLGLGRRHGAAAAVARMARSLVTESLRRAASAALRILLTLARGWSVRE